MAKVVEVRHHHWHNRHAEHPVLAASLEVSSLGRWRPTGLDEEIWKALQDRFAVLTKANTPRTAGELIARIALSIQRQYDCIPDIWGHTAGTADGTDDLFFAARDQFLAQNALEMAASLIRKLFSGTIDSGKAVHAVVDEGYAKLRTIALDQSSLAMMANMIERDIPVFRIDDHQRDLQSGHGHKQNRSIETLTSATSHLGSRHARDKLMCLRLLRAVALPVGKFAAPPNAQYAVTAAERVGYPVVVKPMAGGKGRGVAVNLTSPDEVHKVALAINGPILVQSFLAGDDHRLLVVKGKFLAGAKRVPASVRGDGKRTIRELIDLLNQDPERGRGFDKLKVLIDIDTEVERELARQDWTLSDVPPRGEIVRLRATANISTGGTAIDVTSSIHPDNGRLAERAALVLGLEVAGVDFLCPDITRSWHEVGGGICEVNAVVGLRSEWNANPDRDVVGPIVDIIFPNGDNGRIPTAMVTGTNGKTTTCNMLDVIIRKAGHTVGKATTVGVEVDGERLVTRDWAGALGARVVLADPQVTAAVLETARGGVRKWGTYLDWCDAAALLNVDTEHVGLDGINSVEEMMALKRKVTDCARKAVVLNAESQYTSAVIGDYPAERVIAFSLDEGNKAAMANVARGGRAIVHRAGKRGGAIVLIEPSGEQEIVKISGLPAALGGLARYNIANAMAAAGLAMGLEVPLKTIAAGLRAFETNVDLSPGRLNFIKGYPFDVLFDWATNPHAFAEFMNVAKGLPAKGRKIVTFCAIGNRPNEDYARMAQATSGNFDLYVAYERRDYRRGRAPGEISELIRNGLIDQGVAEEAIRVVGDLAEALHVMAENTQPGDLLIILGSNIHESLPLFEAIFEQHRKDDQT